MLRHSSTFQMRKGSCCEWCGFSGGFKKKIIAECEKRRKNFQMKINDKSYYVSFPRSAMANLDKCYEN